MKTLLEIENPFLGFRERLQILSRPILEKCLLYGEKLSEKEGKILRDFWECSKRGNLLLDELCDMDPIPRMEWISTILDSPGFLSSREKWYANRLKKKDVIVYRGCSEKEHESGFYGVSWTLDPEVAEFFARCQIKNCVILTAKITGAIWLETVESEIIALEVCSDDIVAVDSADKKLDKKMDWDLMVPVRPDLRKTIEGGH